MLVAVLGTGRSRAARLIDLRTGELRHLALHDALTGLANRALINDRLDGLLVRSHRDGIASAVLFIDLDGFKQVNDTLGHHAGDQLLRSVAERLSTRLPSIDTVGRLGGDEFIVLVDGASAVSPALTAQRVLEIIGTPFELDGSAAPVTISASVGIASGHFSSREDLLRSADLALYQAKAGGRNRYDVFEPGTATAVHLRDDRQGSLNLV